MDISYKKNKSRYTIKSNKQKHNKRMACHTNVIVVNIIYTNGLQKQWSRGVFPVGSVTSNGRLLNLHIGPVDVQKGRSMDV